MAKVVKRVPDGLTENVIFLTSVNTPDYSPVDWIINPDLSLLQGIVPQTYWKVSGDSVLEMTTGEKLTKDQAVQDAKLYSTVQTWEPAIGVQSSTSPIWDVVFSGTSEKLLGGNYSTTVGIELRGLTGNSGSQVMGRFAVNGNYKSYWNERNVGDDWMTYNGFDIQPYNDGAKPTITIEFRRVGGTDTVQLRKIRVVLQRVE